MGRRADERAADLVDRVIGGLSVRQWVLTVPHRLRYLMAFALCRAVLVAMLVLMGSLRRRATALGITGGRGGTVTGIRRCGSALDINVHFHTLAADGAFADDAPGALVRDTADGVANDEPSALAAIAAAATLGRAAAVPRAGCRVRRRGANPEFPGWLPAAPCTRTSTASTSTPTSPLYLERTTRGATSSDQIAVAQRLDPSCREMLPGRATQGRQSSRMSLEKTLK